MTVTDRLSALDAGRAWAAQHYPRFGSFHRDRLARAYRDGYLGRDQMGAGITRSLEAPLAEAHRAGRTAAAADGGAP